MMGCQCPKRLWLYKFQPDLADETDEAHASIFQTGIDVGLLARQLFPDGIDASPPTYYQYPQAIADTEKYIRKGVDIIYEAAFQYDGIMAAIDLLVKKNGKWYAFEVKGSGSVKPQFTLDAALQYFVITESGLPLEDISIIHLNTNYVRRGDLDIQNLFESTSVLKEVKALQTAIKTKSEELKKLVKLKSPPNAKIGDQCFKPYNCEFYGFCSKDLIEEDVEQEEEFINKKAIREFLKDLKHPLHFMDFETWMTAIPEQNGHWPFRQIPFQYSLHIQKTPDSDLDHKYYLAESSAAHHLEFVEKLLDSFEKKGSILVYNKTFENTILNNLKEEFPNLSGRIEEIQARMIDLMAPFRKNFRLPAMQGSYSIKYVLPALVPEMSYENMVIGNGTDASSAFYNLKNIQDENEKAKTRQALLDYCGLDTLAMVKILEKLQAIN